MRGADLADYDRNPASPTVAAYTEGLLSMVAEDCRRKPLSTESGWDGVVNFEAQLCGMSWRIVPTQGGPPWRTMFKAIYDPAAWEVFPVAQYIAHDKVAMIHHDLGQFVTNRETLAWTLGLGYSLSYRAAGVAGKPRPAAVAAVARPAAKIGLPPLRGQTAVGLLQRSRRHPRRPTTTAYSRPLRFPDVVANLRPRPRSCARRNLLPGVFTSKGRGWWPATCKPRNEPTSAMKARDLSPREMPPRPKRLDLRPFPSRCSWCCRPR